ncbi:MAG: electron transport complex subunit RsxG [Gammaproteobacteria bacterium]
MASIEPGKFRRLLLSALTLTGFALLGAALVAYTESRTRDQIAENIRRQVLDSLYALVPRNRHDNDLLKADINVQDEELLGVAKPVTAYIATQNNQPVAVLIRSVAPNGYSGPIELLVGIWWNGTLAGVQVVTHRETPGLGDLIDSDKSDWLLGFNNRSLQDPGLERWAVKRDGGDFDQFTGATVTPRAVIKAVKNTLVYFEANKTAMFAAYQTRQE